MLGIVLVKFRGKPTKGIVDHTDKVIAAAKNVKILSAYWTLGRYDAVFIAEVPNEKEAMRTLLRLEGVATETLVALPRDEAVKLLE